MLYQFFIIFVWVMMFGCSGVTNNGQGTDDLYVKKLNELVAIFNEKTEEAIDANNRTAEAVTNALNNPDTVSKSDTKIYYRDSFGIYSDHDRKEKTNLYIVKDTPLDAYTLNFINYSRALDNIWEDNLKRHPDLGWQYVMETKYNSFRIYPWVEMSRSFGPNIDWTKYSFYECATPKMNPNRETCWARIGADVLGMGLISCISKPIYKDNNFIATVTTDFLITKTLGKYLNEKLPGKNSYLMMISADSRVVLRDGRESGERGWDEMFQYKYLNELANTNESVRQFLENIQQKREGFFSLTITPAKRAYYKKLNNVDWTLMIVTEN